MCIVAALYKTDLNFLIYDQLLAILIYLTLAPFHKIHELALYSIRKMCCYQVLISVSVV